MRNSVLVLVSAFFLSCEEPGKIGFTGEEGSGQTVFSDTLAIEASTYLMDSAITSGQAAALVGSFVDPVFGKVTSVAYLQPSLLPNSFANGDSPLTAPDNAIFDSLTLSLINRSLLFYGDSLANMTIQVHRLKESLVFGKNYNYDDEEAYEETLLASKTVSRADFYNPADSSLLYVKMKLPDVVGQELLALANKDESATNEAFSKAFRGFRISAVSGTETIAAFNLGSASASGFSTLNLFYHSSGSTTAEGYIFDFTSSRYNQITSSRTETPLNLLTQKTSSLSSALTNERTFVQAGTGIATKLTFPSIKALSNPQISRAELFFRADTNTFNEDIPLAPYITFLTLDNNQKVTRDNNRYGFVSYSVNPTAGILSTYVDSTNFFVADITPYLQGITSQKKQDNGMILVSGVPSGTVSSSAVFNAGLNRIVLKDFQLNLYYSEK
ncbi:DUF4270 family protein [uncultured Arcticibacterium sp.]|uniref:DUF4270 family protein n=1 Tax=uncultured Arcticibacterium sp. TaxID=2173042 RepID=UPI0030F595A4